MALSYPVNGSDLAEIYPQKIKQAKNLYPLAAKFFRGPNALAEGETLTPQMLKDPQRQKAYYQLDHLIGIAIDSGIDISHLSEFGIIKEGENRYIFDYRINPALISNASLFAFFNKPKQIQRKAQQLRALGLSKKDIQALNRYLEANNPRKQADIAERDYLKSQQQILVKKHSPERGTFHDIVAIHEQSNLVRNKSWNRWTSGLLENLSHYKQRILVEYLQQTKVRAHIVPSPIDKSYFVNFEQQLISGEIVAVLNKNINNTQEQ